ncbi:MAG: TlpA disulfide reductase family protein, partial [Flavobacterium sp.]
VAKSIIKEKAPDFALIDMNGKKITSASLRGKLIVLDFWATWCHPCISSFKAANEVKKSYKDNPNVQFLFANVFEQGSPAEIKKRVIDFSRTFAYDFDFYLTATDEKTPELNVARLFDITNIPVKVLIDKEGYIRYKIIGYDGNDQIEKDKLTYMIDAVLKQ